MRFIILTALIFPTFLGLSQDLIIKRNGDEVICKILEISPNHIKYIIDTVTQLPIYSISVNDVFMTKFQSGLKQVYSPSTNNTQQKNQLTEENIEKDEILIDHRDGNKYSIVKIGEQVWMTENLKYKTQESFCYKNRKEYCEECGQYYTFFEALDACPNGWHLPSDAEWMILESNMGMNPAEAGKSGWRGTHPGQAPTLLMGGQSGLNLKMCGYMDKNAGGGDIYEHAYYWTSTSTSTYSAWIRHFKNRLSIDRATLYKNHHFIPIRCVKD
ncbi:MAG: hypothetical protein HQ542_01470 [Bacteroidia bacterium]|nr:hypothetical protein [Bacteroidia bacterium]